MTMTCGQCGKGCETAAELVAHDCPARSLTWGDFKSWTDEVFIPTLKAIDDAMRAQATRIVQLERRIADLVNAAKTDDV